MLQQSYTLSPQKTTRTATHAKNPYIYLYHTSTSYVKKPWIKGDLYHQMYSADKLLTWWIDQDLKAEYQD